MRSRNLKNMKLFMVLFCITLTSLIILSCSSSSGDDDGGDDNPQTYNASGTYVYDSGTGILTATFTYSEFPGCGPGVGVETYDDDSISATTMVWNVGEEYMIIWNRDSGIAGDITGTWDHIDDIGNAYELTIDANGSINVIADIVECSDGTQCNIKAFVKAHTGVNVTGATVTADGKSCITSAGTCTINNVTPCGGTVMTTAIYLPLGYVGKNVYTYHNGGTSQVQLMFPSPY
jgi:hypothetical protein